MAFSVPGPNKPPVRGTFGSSDDDYLKGTRENDTISGLGGKDTIITFEGDDWLYGGAGDDYLDGGDQNDHLFGEDGADRLFGGEGDDWLYGGDDDDTLKGDDGADYLNGGAGADLIVYGGSDAVTIDLAAGTGSGGAAEGDKLVSIENVYGSAFDDVLIGDGGANGLRGMAGQDTFTGNGGADTFMFGVSFGVLDGGLGADADVITDFSQTDGDMIDVSDVGTHVIINPTPQVIDVLTCTFIGQDVVLRRGGELRFEHVGGNTVVSCDEDGDGAADFEIVCLGTINFSANDFVL